MMSNEFQYFDQEIYDNEVSQENKELLEDYRLDMKSRKLKEGSIYQYTADIKLFLCYVCTQLKNKAVPLLRKKQFRRFFIDFQETGVSNARINRMQCSLRNFLEYCVNDEDIVDEYDNEVNYMQKIKGLLKEEVREIIFLTDEEVNKLIDELVKRKEYQKALLIAISYESGARRNEIYQVTKTSLLDTTNNNTNEVVGKRGKKFKLRYFKKTKEVFKLFLEQRGEDNKEFLWYKEGKDGVEEVGYNTLYSWVVECRQVLADVTGEYKLFNNHSFRHSCAENLLNGSHYILGELKKDNLSLEQIKLLLKHDSSETTQLYVIDKSEKEEEELFSV